MEPIKQFPEINLRHLESAVAEWMQARERLVAHDNSEKLIAPEGPDVFNSQHDINKYRELIEQYNNWVNQFNARRIELWKFIDEAEKKVTIQIPKYSWFKVYYDDKPLWIGISTSNWQGGTVNLVSSDTEPTKKLSHTYYD